TPLRMALSKITPVTVAEEGRNSFRIEARLAELGPQLRPGMEGVAKIETGQRSLVWIWTRAVVEWLRLVAWEYLPLVGQHECWAIFDFLLVSRRRPSAEAA